MRSFALSACLSLLALPGLAEPMWFKTVGNGGNCGGCDWTIAEGEITADSPAALLAHLQSDPYTRTLRFNSKGGNLGAALELGRIIRNNGLSTQIGKAEPIPDTRYYESVDGGTCESACAFAFLAGAARYPGEGTDPDTPGRLGMHQFYTRDGDNIPSTDTQQIMGQVLLYMLDMGLDAEILTIAARTPPDDMHFFTTGELRDLGIVTFGGSEPTGLFVENDGLATGWRTRHDTGETASTVTLMCSRAVNGWVLRIRVHGTDIYTPSWNGSLAEPIGGQIGAREYSLAPSDILDHKVEEFDRVLDVRLPDVLPAFAGQEFSFEVPGPRSVNFAYFSAGETLPDAETFSVIARACGA